MDDGEMTEIKIVRQTNIYAFWHGAIFWLAINSLYQDILGKEAFIQKVQTDWIDGSITIPLAIGGMIFIMIDLAWKKIK